jgi:hypothetical protein
MSQGHLATKTDQKLNAKGSQNGVADGVADTEVVGARKQRYQDKKDCKEQDHFAFDKFGLKPGLILGVVLVVNTAG